MIVQQITRGIAAHWQIRISEWVMLLPAIGMGLALIYQPGMFNTSKSFDVLAKWGAQEQWAAFVLGCAVVRLAALTINGTFESFPWSPHCRLLASLVGIIFWSRFALAVLTAALFNGGAWSGPVAYSTLCVLELVNFYRCWKDIAAGPGKP